MGGGCVCVHTEGRYQHRHSTLVRCGDSCSGNGERITMDGETARGDRQQAYRGEHRGGTSQQRAQATEKPRTLQPVTSRARTRTMKPAAHRHTVHTTADTHGSTTEEKAGLNQ